ncbi:MAG TPA: DegT/DnrJ/EryC1/StrS family aminotransferase [Thermoleophilaceae bacterium]|nr:DegT/DnrJ/EryC1/StrS family aminotransferase [Thermoleophilaceae bacterium]
MSWRYPLSTLPMPEDDVQAVMACLQEGWLTMGPRTQAFEGALAQELGAASVACVASGTAALHLACRAAGLGPGDEAIVPSMTFVATAGAVRYCGAEPVFCDVASAQAPNLDVAAVEAKITDRTKAVMAVHFCGYPADVVALRDLCDQRGLILIEDAAQAIHAVAGPGGATAGTVGHLGCLSFFSKKQLCVGEGGAVITADPDMEARVRSLRSHAMTSVTWDRHRGYAQSYDVVDVGYNFRMDEPRAALGLSRLPRLAGEIERRRAVAAGYRERLAGVDGIELMWDDDAVRAASHFAFPVLAADREARDRARDQLKDAGIQTTWYPAVHRFTEYRDRDGWEPLAASEEVAERHFCLPMSPTLEDADLDAIAEEVARVG